MSAPQKPAVRSDSHVRSSAQPSGARMRRISFLACSRAQHGNVRHTRELPACLAVDTALMHTPAVRPSWHVTLYTKLVPVRSVSEDCQVHLTTIQKDIPVAGTYNMQNPCTLVDLSSLDHSDNQKKASERSTESFRMYPVFGLKHNDTFVSISIEITCYDWPMLNLTTRLIRQSMVPASVYTGAFLFVCF